MLFLNIPGLPSVGLNRTDQGREEVVAAAARGLREGQPVDRGAELGQHRDDGIRPPHRLAERRLEVRRVNPDCQLDVGATEL